MAPFIIRVPFFLLFGFNKETLTQKGQKGTTRNLVSNYENLECRGAVSSVPFALRILVLLSAKRNVDMT